MGTSASWNPQGMSQACNGIVLPLQPGRTAAVSLRNILPSAQEKDTV